MLPGVLVAVHMPEHMPSRRLLIRRQVLRRHGRPLLRERLSSSESPSFLRSRNKRHRHPPTGYRTRRQPLTGVDTFLSSPILSVPGIFGGAAFSKLLPTCTPVIPPDDGGPHWPSRSR